VSEFESSIPILSVRDFSASVDYYVNKLGVKRLWDWGQPPAFGCISRGNVEIFLCQGAQGQSGTWMAINVTNVDALYEEYKTSGAIIIEPPANYSWGMRKMLVGDLDDHRFRVGGPSGEPLDESQFNRA